MADLVKILKVLGTGVKEEMDSLSEEQLRALVVESEATISQTRDAMKSDDKLNGARLIVKDLSGGYRDVIKAQGGKTAYALYLLGEKGKI